jgi:eukaryotic-like serine/threonine-protein kinase
MSTISDATRLGGVSEVAAELGVSRQQVAKLRQRDDFPSPVASLTMGEIWDLGTIRRWADSGLRRGAGRPSAAAAILSVGRRFELGPQVGGGGFAEVFSAQDLTGPSGTWVAVKFLRQAHALDPEMVARFQRELRLMSQLSHPHVMPVLASGTDERLGLWYAMPYALGSLADELGTRMADERIVEVMRNICAGLAYIHANKILHRDLKPANVLRTQAGTWAIADFGLARPVVETTIRITATAEAMGSRFYTAPEQWRDAKRVDERADVYSTGKILQALVTGSAPVADDVPPGNLRPVIQRAISQDPRHRHQSAAELLAAIEAAIAPPSPAGRWETPEERSRRLRQRLATRPDPDAMYEIVRWASEIDPVNYDEMGEFVQALSMLPAEAVEAWWNHDREALTRTFLAFAGRLDGSFDFDVCDPLANFAQRAVTVTGDQIILREAVRGLAALGSRHNRWHVRDVAVAILQSIRDDEHAVAALEGLRMAGRSAAEWTVGKSVVGTFHPILRAGLDQFLYTDQEPRR